MAYNIWQNGDVKTEFHERSELYSRFSKSNPTTWRSPAIHHDSVAILHFFGTLLEPENRICLVLLNREFEAFLQQYYPGKQQPPKPNFTTAMDNSDNQFTLTVLPIPSVIDLQEHHTWKGDPNRTKNALSLFIYEFLLKRGLISQQDMDEVFFYCQGLIGPGVINTELIEHKKLFYESGPHGLIAHGKYSHMIQLMLISIAVKQRCLRLKTPLAQLVPNLVENKIILNPGTGIQENSFSCWDYALDLSRDSIAGPICLHTIVLFFEELCPTLQRYVYSTYLRMLKEQYASSPGEQPKEMNTSETIEACVKLSVDRKAITPKLGYRYSYGNKHKTARVNLNEPNMLHKTARDPEFERVHKQIRATHPPSHPQPPRFSQKFRMWLLEGKNPFG